MRLQQRRLGREVLLEMTPEGVADGVVRSVIRVGEDDKARAQHVLAASATEGLREACLDALKLDRRQVRAFAEKFSWRACAEDFVRNLQPYPEPEKTRFWRRLRRLARVRRKRPEAA